MAMAMTAEAGIWVVVWIIMASGMAAAELGEKDLHSILDTVALAIL